MHERMSILSPHLGIAVSSRGSAGRLQMLIGAGLIVLAALAFVWSRQEASPMAIINEGDTPTTARFERTGAVLALEVATSTEARTKGLGGREALLENTALLMVFPEDGAYGIWMKDMLFPIDVLWLDRRGRIIDLVERMAPETYPQAFVPGEPARYVLETHVGFVSAQGVALGDLVEFE